MKPNSTRTDSCNSRDAKPWRSLGWLELAVMAVTVDWGVRTSVDSQRNVRGSRMVLGVPRWQKPWYIRWMIAPTSR